VPYRVDLREVGRNALDRLLELGALDAEIAHDGALAALMPDSVPPEHVVASLGTTDVIVSPATARDEGSVWVLSLRPVHVRGRDLRLIDANAFGTGLHPTTALCLEAIDEIVTTTAPTAMLDVGTGSGVLALAALVLGVPHAHGIDIDDGALRVAGENARLNALDERLQLTHGGPDVVAGTWPFIVANVLAAPLIEMAPVLVRRVGHHGQLVLSGIPTSVERDVAAAYRRLGMRHVRTTSRAGWIALVMQATW
jgi:ribosomal protein L11 methylase PrmA